MGLYDEASKVAADYLKAAYKGEKVNGSKKAINAIVNNGFGGMEMVGRFLGGEGAKSIERTFAKAGEDGVRSASNGWDAGKIAGSYLGVSAAGRVLSGGGVYKDSNGNTNLIGVPFV
jgi:hypothetical protein